MCRKFAGFGLTELLVSFFISTLLILILTQHLLSVSRQYHQIHATLDQAMELQWVFDVIRDRVHHAGFTPCRRLDHLIVADTRDSPESLLPIEVETGEHIKLNLRKMNEAVLTQVIIQTNVVFFINQSVRLHVGRPILIADCMHAEVHDIDSIQPTRGGKLVTLKKPLVFDYEPEVYVGEWMSEAFYFKQGLFYKQHRADKLTSQIKRVQFSLDNHTNYPKLSMLFVLHNGTSGHLEARVRMP